MKIMFLVFFFLLYFVEWTAMVVVAETETNYNHRWGVILNTKGTYFGTPKQEIESKEKGFLTHLEQLHIPYKVETRLHELIHFIALCTCHQADVKNISLMKEVLHVFPDTPTKVTGHDEAAADPFFHPLSMYMKKRGLPYSHVIPELLPHRYTGVDTLHAQGYYGQNIKIGVLDMGIDKQHPVFGCNQGRGTKCAIFRYRDYVTPKGAPMDSGSGHGTKVGGILVGRKGSYVGVVPEAKLFMYRIFGPQGDVTFTRFYQALEDAMVKDEVDILNLSFGTPDPWNLSNLTTVLETTVAHAKTIVVSVAGNQKGLFVSNAPGNSPYVLSVTSLDSPGIMVRTMVVNGFPIEYLGSITHPLHPTYLRPTVVVLDPFLLSSFTCDTEDVFVKSPFALQHRTVVVYQGKCRSETISNIIKHALKSGAASVLVAVNSEDLSEPHPIDGWRLTGWNWAKIRQQDAERAFSRTPGVYQPVPMELNLMDHVLPHPSAGQLSRFASFGPMANYQLLKPELAGFGKNVYVPIPTQQGTWGFDEGTSLTAPYVAGCIALVFQVRGKMPLDELRSLLMTSAQPVYIEKGWAAPVHGQGAGLIQVDKALMQLTRLEPLSGLTITIEDDHYETVVTLENTADTPLMYTFRHVPALTIQGLDTQVKVPLHVSFSPPNVLISPHQKRSVKVHFTSPTQAMVGTLFSGYLVMEPFSANLTRYPLVHYPYTAIRGQLDFRTMYPEVIRYTVNGQDTNTTFNNEHVEKGFPIFTPGYSLEIGFQVTRPLRQFCILVYRLDQHNPSTRYWVGYLFRREYVFPGFYRIVMEKSTFMNKWGGSSSLKFPAYYQLVTLGAFGEPGVHRCDQEWLELPKEGIPGRILFLF